MSAIGGHPALFDSQRSEAFDAAKARCRGLSSQSRDIRFDAWRGHSCDRGRHAEASLARTRIKYSLLLNVRFSQRADCWRFCQHFASATEGGGAVHQISQPHPRVRVPSFERLFSVRFVDKAVDLFCCCGDEGRLCVSESILRILHTAKRAWSHLRRGNGLHVSQHSRLN